MGTLSRRAMPGSNAPSSKTRASMPAAKSGASSPGLPPPWVTAQPEDVGMDGEPLEKCKQYLHYRIGRKHFSGIVGGVVKNGKLVYFDEAGYADVATKTPMKQDTIVRLFSMTKCLVVVAFLAYAEDPCYGIDLDDPVWKYIPSFKKIFVRGGARGGKPPRDVDKETVMVQKPGETPVKEQLPSGPTLRQLLTHTAGLGYGPTIGDNWPPEKNDHYRIYHELLDKVNKGEVASLADFVDELAKVGLKVRPGSYWEYSFATDVLGRVLEVISQKSLEETVQEKVCRPLGMVDTSFVVPLEKAHRVGAWYQRRPPADDKGKELGKVQPGATWCLEVLDKAGAECGWCPEKCSKILSGGGTVEIPLSMKGGMVSTFRDYLRFLIMIRNQGELEGVRILKRETVQSMICNQVPAATGRKSAWVFDKKGQGFNFLGQIQVQFLEKDTFQEKGELKKGTNSYACLAPGTVSGEFGWGGLGGPAWTIDPRADLIILSMTQTALELDHEENLRFSARRAIHAGIFGRPTGPSKVTDLPPEFHEAPHRQGKEKKDAIQRAAEVPQQEEKMFAEEEHQSLTRRKTLKELAVSSGNVGHEIKDVEDDPQELSASKADRGPHEDPASPLPPRHSSDIEEDLKQKVSRSESSNVTPSGGSKKRSAREAQLAP